MKAGRYPVRFSPWP